MSNVLYRVFVVLLLAWTLNSCDFSIEKEIGNTGFYIVETDLTGIHYKEEDGTYSEGCAVNIKTVFYNNEYIYAQQYNPLKTDSVTGYYIIKLLTDSAYERVPWRTMYFKDENEYIAKKKELNIDEEHMKLAEISFWDIHKWKIILLVFVTGFVFLVRRRKQVIRNF